MSEKKLHLELSLEEIKLINALIRYSDPTSFFTKDLTTKIKAQVESQFEHEVDKIDNIQIVSKDKGNNVYRRDC